MATNFVAHPILAMGSNRGRIFPFRSLAELILPISQENDVPLMTSPTSLMKPVLQEPLAGSAEMPMNTIVSIGDEVHVSTLIHEEHISAEERALGEIERFRVAALETLERSLDRVITSVAEEVLCRELALSPCDMQEIINRALRRYERESPIRLRVAPNDVARVQADLPIISDANLQEGDLVIEVRDGSLESRLAVRLACTVARLQGTR